MIDRPLVHQVQIPEADQDRLILVVVHTALVLVLDHRIQGKKVYY
jgi:hypothetical protein